MGSLVEERKREREREREKERRRLVMSAADATTPLLQSSSESPNSGRYLRRRSKDVGQGGGETNRSFEGFEGEEQLGANMVNRRTNIVVRNVKKLLRRKTVEDVIAQGMEGEGTNEGLKRSLTAVDLIAYGIGATVGAGLFVVTGEAAKRLAGPSVSLSFVVAAFSGLLSALCYAEFSTRIPVAGGAYAYSYVCFGEAVAWLVGWNLTLEYGMSASVVARGFSDYFVAFLNSIGLSPPELLYNIPLSIPYLSPRGSILSSLIVILCTGALLLGASESARLNVAITTLNMALILFIIVAGFSEVEKANYIPFFPYGAEGVMRGAGFVFFSYVGFDCICVLAEELKDPKRDLPIAIVGTLVTVAGLYVVVSLILTGMIKYTDINLNAPLSDAFIQMNMPWAAIVVAFGTTTILTSTTLCSLFGQPRVFFAMAKDGLVPQKLAAVNAKTQVPDFSTYLSGGISALLAFCLDIDSLAGMISAGTMLSFTLVSLGILVVRYEDTPESRKSDARFFSKYYFWLTAFCVLNIALGIVMVYIPSCPAGVQGFLGLLTLAPIGILASFPQNQVNQKATEDGEAGSSVFTGSIFKCPWVPWIPALAVMINIHLILSLDLDTLCRLAIWSALGYFFYFIYGFHHSKLNAHAYYHTL